MTMCSWEDLDEVEQRLIREGIRRSAFDEGAAIAVMFCSIFYGFILAFWR